ncbi:zinc finger protein 239 [Tribolium castaneum]|uniref:Zinc finger protein 624-like Protein n=1 Tax=Tribolium castaneum TaxID=7070 RepID=D6WL84_TRICA|nr:PREDICTED: zinc finger protein 239 [Tribolium castaneum]EFA04078.1 Zinc finger protein 624-like Protein [Tribolium castaneum]|eukprot:XP_008193722.1 PREDICTED: zinc finger protein 239 [Tribolium castaneum]
MAQPLCTLCECPVETLHFDLRQSVSNDTRTPLLMLLQDCAEEEFCITNYFVCEMCYRLLNELDSIKVRARNIENKFKQYLRKHCPNKNYIEREASNKSEECTMCGQKIPGASFKDHLKTHDLETGFNIDDLSSVSEIQSTLDLFTKEAGSESVKKKQKDGTDPKPYKCTQCSKTWKTPTELKNHMSAHSKERPYICEICGQAYKRQQALTIHVGMHKGINPFTCVYCNKSFTQKGALMRHTPIHTGELPFQCDTCGKRFVHHTSFNIHKITHTGQKPYKCDVCGFLLISASHLKRHMRVHTGEKKFSCGTCGKKFAEKYNLAVHEKLHLGVSKKKTYQCQICDNVYNGQMKLEEHLLSVHHKVHPTDPLSLP